MAERRSCYHVTDMLTSSSGGFGTQMHHAGGVPENVGGSSPAPERSILENLRSDYRRHGSTLRSLPFWAIANYRLGNWFEKLPKPLRYVGGKIYGVNLLWVEVTTGILLNREARIGRDFHLVHSGNTKVHPGTVIGDRVGVMHDVTIGTTPERDGAPQIGNDVFIGAGAKILGPVKIGDRARIAANSLVISDVPADTTAIGVPAKILRYTGRTPPGTEPPPSPPS